jgi:hypothetical protein
LPGVDAQAGHRQRIATDGERAGVEVTALTKPADPVAARRWGGLRWSPPGWGRRSGRRVSPGSPRGPFFPPRWSLRSRWGWLRVCAPMIIPASDIRRTRSGVRKLSCSPRLRTTPARSARTSSVSSRAVSRIAERTRVSPAPQVEAVAPSRWHPQPSTPKVGDQNQRPGSSPVHS